MQVVGGPMQFKEYRFDALRGQYLSEKEEMNELLNHLRSILKLNCQIELRADPMRGWELFSRLPESSRKSIKDFVVGQIDFIQEAVFSGIDPRSERAMLRHALSKLRIICDDSVYEKVEGTDVVEILDKNLTQVYRSFSCFYLCNYSILELTSVPFFDLYERSSVITKSLIDACGEVLEGRSNLTSLAAIGSYPVRELLTEEKNSFFIQEKFVAKSLGCIDGKTYVISVKRVSECDSRKVGQLAFI